MRADKKDGFTGNPFIINLLLITGVISAFLLMPILIHAEQYPPSTQINFLMELTNSAGNPITGATCEGRIYNSSLNLLNTLSLSYDSNTGLYHSPFTTPSSEGQYIQKGECNTTNGKTTISRKELTITSTANLDAKLTSINDTVKSVNSTIMTKLYAMQDEISSVNDTVKSESSNLNNSIAYWGNTNLGQTNYWGNSIYNFLQGLAIGNVTVTANVDYDEIAITVISYLRGVTAIGMLR